MSCLCENGDRTSDCRVQLVAPFFVYDIVSSIYAEEVKDKAVNQDGFITLEEVKKHNTRDSCWVIVGDKVLVTQLCSLTHFVNIHPGGAEIIMRHAGMDVNALFTAIHSPNVLKMLKPEQCVGTIDVATLPSRSLDVEEQQRIALARSQRPLVSVINLNDFEAAASEILTRTAWAYYSSAAEDGTSYDNNLQAFKRYGFKPRVMRPVGTVDIGSSMLGIPTAMPVFVCPAALAGLGHPEGELNITRAAGKAGIIQGATNATFPIEDIAAARLENQPLFYQLYVNRDRKESERIIRLVDELGFKGIMLTVDAPILGKREKDMRMHLPKVVSLRFLPVNPTGVSASLDSMFDANLQWSDIAWIKSITKLPVIIKGVQTVEDVELAVENGASGVLLSNHGGRQLSYAPAAIDVLYELRQRRPDLFDRTEIYIDGGIRRGSDVVKALALGARGVGLGRPFLYSNAYGERGVAKAIGILEEEIVTTMCLVGARKVSDLVPEMVCRYPTRSEGISTPSE
ncbi:hypothetical protein M408DRAFT_74720 [Serendipita vermifera MAFF 305830]|uniref:L-lactate dehydrogenase (cytochrome) n=1 Tax=Serendipita vermifera MAFF 305830 TaxID=933852 RepID=A0A0C2WFJ9_SERVB|nr:hypothetical protein M408DRAFT_74720 [Serendipita vermifera MAFF 305830]